MQVYLNISHQVELRFISTENDFFVIFVLRYTTLAFPLLYSLIHALPFEVLGGLLYAFQVFDLFFSSSHV